MLASGAVLGQKGLVALRVAEAPHHQGLAWGLIGRFENLSAVRFQQRSSLEGILHLQGQPRWIGSSVVSGVQREDGVAVRQFAPGVADVESPQAKDLLIESHGAWHMLRQQHELHLLEHGGDNQGLLPPADAGLLPGRVV